MKQIHKLFLEHVCKHACNTHTPSQNKSIFTFRWFPALAHVPLSARPRGDAVQVVKELVVVLHLVLVRQTRRAALFRPPHLDTPVKHLLRRFCRHQ